MEAHKHSILVVDDDPAIREFMEMVLTEEGYTVQTADDGINALSHLNDAIPELIISDLYMPNMSGFEFLPIVRQHFPEWPSLPLWRLQRRSGSGWCDCRPVLCERKQHGSTLGNDQWSDQQ